MNNDTVWMIAFTRRGTERMDAAAAAFGAGHPELSVRTAVFGSACPERREEKPLREFVGEIFPEAGGIVFFSAAGIAVRAVGPFLADKYTDPAVVVIDEGGNWCISLLSGHLGGANALCREMAALTGAQPVVTTATDTAGAFAVDLWAKEQKLLITDREKAKRISARILAGETMRIFGAEAGSLPEARGCVGTGERAEADIIVSMFRKSDDRENALHLVPKEAVLGIGARRGVSEEAVRKAFSAFCEETSLLPEAVRELRSIDLKAEEAGILSFSKSQNIPARFFSAEELNAVPGTFSDSSFVREVTGVDCVCERSAASAGGGLLAGKHKYGPVTLALGKTGAYGGVK